MSKTVPLYLYMDDFLVFEFESIKLSLSSLSYIFGHTVYPKSIIYSLDKYKNHFMISKIKMNYPKKEISVEQLKEAYLKYSFINKNITYKYSEELSYYFLKSYKPYQDDNHINLAKKRLLTVKDYKLVSLFKNLIDKEYNLSQVIVIAKCEYCKNTYEIKATKLLKYSSLTESDNYIFACNLNKKCRNNKGSDLIYQAVKAGKPYAKGHVVTEDQLSRWKESLSKSDSWKAFHNNKKGKKIEEIYGETVGKQTREKIKAFRASQEIEPHLGCKHSIQVRQRMSDTKKAFYNEDPERALAVGRRNKISWSNKTEEQKSQTRLAWSKAINERVAVKHKNWSYHTPWYDDSLSFIVQSSYEKRYMQILDTNKVFYKKSNIYIKYFDSVTNKTKHYNPDIEIYQNDILIEVHEIKPKFFLTEESEYGRLTRLKIDALKNYCMELSLTYKIITEEDLFNENCKYKDYKKEYKNLLLKCAESQINSTT